MKKIIFVSLAFLAFFPEKKTVNRMDVPCKCYPFCDPNIPHQDDPPDIPPWFPPGPAGPGIVKSYAI